VANTIVGRVRLVPDDPERIVEVAGREVRISSPDKVYFPALESTKSDLVDYYLEVGEALLNTAGGRPAMLQRFPHGATGKSFFQKRVPAGAPAWLETTIVSTPNGTTSNALVVADVAHVLWAVNLGCLGLHLWPYRAADAEHADELRIDLDPQPGVGFDEVRTAAYHCRDLFTELGLVAYAKTTGNRGIHIYMRLEPNWDSTQVRACAVAVARELERRFPDLITANWWKEERGKQVFVDFNQNAPHKTVFGAWFARPRTGGQVSTPLSWEEVATVVPDDLTIRTVPELLKKRGDPWAEIAKEPQSLGPLFELVERDKAAGLHDAPWPPEYPKAPDEPPRVAPSRAKKT
jgi:DNA ligase D